MTEFNQRTDIKGKLKQEEGKQQEKEWWAFIRALLMVEKQRMKMVELAEHSTNVFQ